MPESISNTGFTNVFASFDGELDNDRIVRLFDDRSLADRGKSLAICLISALIVFIFARLSSRGQQLPSIFQWLLSIGVSLGVFGFGLMHQIGRWHRWRWLRWNKLLAGKYQAILHDDYIDIKASNFAMRLPYSSFAQVDSGRSCVRMSFDSRACRAILLPIDDCQPHRSVHEIQTYIREHRADAKRRLVTPKELDDQNLPLPITLSNERELIDFDGPLHQVQVLEAIEADKSRSKTIRIQTLIYSVMAVCFVVILVLLYVSKDRQIIPAHEMGKLISIPILLFFAILGAIRYRSAKKNIEADPNANIGHLKGWISPNGFASHYRDGYKSIAWSACDSIDTTQNCFIVRFWKGDYMIFGKHLFPTNIDYAKVIQWIETAVIKKE